jgi:bifunctional non-homologous end joining protein LigD
MYATIGDDVPRARGWTFEPKYDGMRVLAFASANRVRLLTRNQKDKSAQFPEIVDALKRFTARLARPVILDGEIVALERGRPGHFQTLQGRMHLKSSTEIAERSRVAPATFVAFDLLQDGKEVFLREPWSARRLRLEKLFARTRPGVLRVSETTRAGSRMIDRARRAGWEGVIAKRTDAPYIPGARSRDWLKLKLQYRAEFVVGGFTEPRRSRQFIGSLLLGYFDARGLFRYVGNMGGGFNRASLEEMYRRLRPLERARSPFDVPPRTNEKAHWVVPKVVVEVKFGEWTTAGKLRQPIFLGVRDDKDARDVHLEKESVQRWAHSGSVRVAGGKSSAAASVTKARRPAAARRSRSGASSPSVDAVLRQLDHIEADGGEGTLRFERGRELHVSSLNKVYFGESGKTKGDLFRYYVRVSPYLLPLMKDRPLILKRYPNGIDGPFFFQQNAGANVPNGVRVAEVIATEDGERVPRIIGGDLLTLLYLVQLGTIAIHTWLSRLKTLQFADYSVIDLDPGDGVSFSRVVELARRILAELDAMGLRAAVKTSGSSGIHIAIPLAARTPFDRAAALAWHIAEGISREHPALATTERHVKSRPRGTIYVDAQQNAYGKSVVSAYSVREREAAPVSAPIDRAELKSTLKLEAFTIDTMPARLVRVGDMWATSLKARNAARIMNRIVADGS